jgi:hypothetical protein
MVVAIVVIIAVTTTIRTVLSTIFGRRSHYSGETRESRESGGMADARLSRLEQAVDAIAVEVERISEGQRFTTKLLSEQARQGSKLSRELTNTPT